MSRVPRSGSVIIENVTGPHEFDINGVYEPTIELCGGLPAFQKKGSGNVWLEYYSSKWYVRPKIDRGTKKGWAFIMSERPCFPHDCDEGAWFADMDVDSNEFESAPLVALTLLSAPLSDLNNIVEQVQEAYDVEVLALQ